MCTKLSGFEVTAHHESKDNFVYTFTMKLYIQVYVCDMHELPLGCHNESSSGYNKY